MLRLTAERLKLAKFPRLIRPSVESNRPVTRELVNWAIQAYSLPWTRHFAVLIGGIVTLSDCGNKAAVRIVGRSSFELCAHAYYVKKHVKQHLDSGNLAAAWDFLSIVGTGSRYVNELYPEESTLFPESPHIGKAINCFKEVMEKEAQDDYSYLSEYCHPNAMTFQQHYRWTTPYIIDFVDEVTFAAFGAIAGSSILGLMAIVELLAIGNETEVRQTIKKLLIALVDQDKREDASRSN